VGDSDGGSLDGDPNVDRAVGPMQFIPTSWRAFGRDGNGDGVRDPQNMYDAALAAAVLLCRTRGLEADDAMRRAFLAYNNSGAYATLVLQRTHGYDAFQIPPVP
jgi:membrane-bound lytic murein transglycosylase B